MAVVVVAGLSLRGPSSRPTVDPVVVQTSAGGATATRQAMIGEEARDGQLVFVVDDFACSTKQASNPAALQAPGRLCTLRFNVKNSSSSPARFLGRFQYLVDAQSRTHGVDEALTRALPENGTRNITELNINPEAVVALTFVYDLPDSVEPREAQFKGTGRSRFGINVALQRRP